MNNRNSKGFRNRALRMALALALVLSLFAGLPGTTPEGAYAAGYTIDISGSPGSGTGYTWNSTTKIITFGPAANAHSYTLISTGTQNINGIDIESGTNAKITLSKVTLSTARAPIALLGNAKLELTLSGASSLTATGDSSAGIQVTGNAALIIKGSGSVSANGGRYGAGIGGGVNSGGGVITINGGTVSATGGEYGAGIGGGGAYFTINGYSGGTITINGGTVNASGKGSGAGVGGGEYGDGGKITINGGTVNANGGVYGYFAFGASAGIGGGRQGNGGTITVNGGTVSATGQNGSGIGGGSSGEAGTIKISKGMVTAISEKNSEGIGGVAGAVVIQGGTVTANGGEYSAGIGGDSCDVTISGGTVTAEGGHAGAGIGCGSNRFYITNSAPDGYKGTITINGGNVKARGSSEGAGVGGGFRHYGGNITITKGTVEAYGGYYGGAGIGGGNDALNNPNTRVTIGKDAVIKAFASEKNTPAIEPYNKNTGRYIAGYFNSEFEEARNFYAYKGGGAAVTTSFTLPAGYVSFAYTTRTTAAQNDRIYAYDTTRSKYFGQVQRVYDSSPDIPSQFNAAPTALKLNPKVLNPGDVAVKFDPQGGSVASGQSVKSLQKGSAVGALPAAKKTGYAFLGWYTAKTGGAKISPSTKVSANTTYYAHWKVAKYKVTFVANGGKVKTKSKQITYGKKIGKLPTPTRKKYKFLGWYKKKNKTTVYNAKKGKYVTKIKYSGKVSAKTTVKGAMKLYAKWQKK